jgi:hypothetical protein
MYDFETWVMGNLLQDQPAPEREYSILVMAESKTAATPFMVV